MREHFNSKLTSRRLIEIKIFKVRVDRENICWGGFVSKLESSSFYHRYIDSKRSQFSISAFAKKKASVAARRQTTLRWYAKGSSLSFARYLGSFHFMRLLRRTLIHFARLLFPERRKNRLLCSHVIQEIVRCDSDIGLGSTSLCASVDSPEREEFIARRIREIGFILQLLRKVYAKEPDLRSRGNLTGRRVRAISSCKSGSRSNTPS